MTTIDKQQLIDAAQALGHELEDYRQLRDEAHAAHDRLAFARQKLLDQIGRVEAARQKMLEAAGDFEQAWMDKAIDDFMETSIA